LIDKNAPFGVDLLLPQVGGSAPQLDHEHLFAVSVTNKNTLFYSFHIDPGMLEVWDSSNRLPAELLFNLPFKCLKMDASELDNHDFDLNKLYNPFVTN
jgi:hypothetical protein